MLRYNSARSALPPLLELELVGSGFGRGSIITEDCRRLGSGVISAMVPDPVGSGFHRRTKEKTEFLIRIRASPNPGIFGFATSGQSDNGVWSTRRWCRSTESPWPGCHVGRSGQLNGTVQLTKLAVAGYHVCRSGQSRTPFSTL
ncbi:hypothetical protein TIFTF001_001172 [Ficus carica]|uniref:Uncharacterized protein n=1 Tax=Ficus carica TaxID=3494 RepID=A0AA88D3X2_FICCA|nr:hypothetical protein TIFTF001_001172 [Ficus carica]